MHVSDSIPIPQFNRSIEKPITFHVSFLKFFLMLDRAKCKISCHLSLLMKYNRVLSGLSYIGCNEQKLQKRDYLRWLNAEQFWFAIPNTLRFTVRENRLLTSSPIRWHWRHDGYSEVGFTDVQELTLAKEKTTTFHAELIDTVAFSSLYLSFSLKYLTMGTSYMMQKKGVEIESESVSTNAKWENNAKTGNGWQKEWDKYQIVSLKEPSESRP